MRHPESGDNEVFIINTNNPEFNNQDIKLGLFVGFQTLRVGTVGFDIYGNILVGHRPVFARREEIIAAFGVETLDRQLANEKGHHSLVAI